MLFLFDKHRAETFDNFDACDPVVPYLVVNGNHDVRGGDYQGLSEGYNRYFGTDRWLDRGYGCADPTDCDWDAGAPRVKRSRVNHGT